MAKGRKESRSQIDFLLVSYGVPGHASPRSMVQRTFRRSDHRLIAGNLSISIGLRFRGGQSPLLNGWRLVGGGALEMFKQSCLRVV